MLIEDLMQDLYKANANEVEFNLINQNGEVQKLELFITMGRYLYPKKKADGSITDIVILGLIKPEDDVDVKDAKTQ
jgi:hypothetical protein